MTLTMNCAAQGNGLASLQRWAWRPEPGWGCLNLVPPALPCGGVPERGSLGVRQARSQDPGGTDMGEL